MSTTPVLPAALNLDLLRPIVDNALDLVDHKGFLKRREPLKYQKRAPSTADVAAVITNAVLKIASLKQHANYFAPHQARLHTAPP